MGILNRFFGSLTKSYFLAIFEIYNLTNMTLNILNKTKRKVFSLENLNLEETVKLQTIDAEIKMSDIYHNVEDLLFAQFENIHIFHLQNC